MNAHKIHIAVGDPGIETTLREMRRIVLRSNEDPSVIEWAQGVVRNLPERDPDATANAFLAWVRSNVRYTEDPVEVESVKTPEAMLLEFSRFGRVTGDCDDQVVLLAAGLNAVGIETEFIVVAADPAFPNDFSHVLLQFQGRDGWVTLDPIMRGTGPGWFPERTSRVGRLSGGRLRSKSSGFGSGLLAFLALLWLARRA